MDLSRCCRSHQNRVHVGLAKAKLADLVLFARACLMVFAIAMVSCAADVTDFDIDGDSDIDDLNLLLSLGPLIDGYIVEPGVPDPFDLTADGFVNNLDVAEWLVIAARVNELASPYKEGDATLDGTVDGSDFLMWYEGRFTSTLRWDRGDFNGDGIADGSDVLLWNHHKFTNSFGVTTVPEPCSGVAVALGLILLQLASRCAQQGAGRDQRI